MASRAFCSSVSTALKVARGYSGTTKFRSVIMTIRPRRRLFRIWETNVSWSHHLNTAALSLWTSLLPRC